MSHITKRPIEELAASGHYVSYTVTNSVIMTFGMIWYEHEHIYFLSLKWWNIYIYDVQVLVWHFWPIRKQSHNFLCLHSGLFSSFQCSWCWDWTVRYYIHRI